MNDKWELTRGERKVLSLLLKNKALTWSELLNMSNLSRPGLSKILKSLIQHEIIGYTTKMYKGKPRVAYKPLVKSIVEADSRLFYRQIYSHLKEAKTFKEVKEILEDEVIDFIQYLFLTYLHDALETGKPNKIVKELNREIKYLFTEVTNIISNRKRIKKKMIEYLKEEYEQL